jgi:DNA-binding HxlR family transcriptional regulator
MNPHFSSYLDEIPLDIIRPLRAFGNNFRLILIRELSTRGSLSLTQIQNHTDKGTGYIIHNLKQLEMAGLVQNFLQEREDTREYSYYELTLLCVALIEIVLTSITSQMIGSDKTSRIASLTDEASLERMEMLCKGLGNRFRLALVKYLEDRTSLSFSEIVASTHQEKNVISAHLKKLECAGIVQNFLRRERDTAEYSFYELTRLGSILLDGLHKTYNLETTPETKKSMQILESGVQE